MSLGDLSVSRVGLGCNNFGGRLDLGRTRAVVEAALDVGITLLDTADIYGNRSGAAVYGNLGASERYLDRLLSGRREKVVLATKFGHDMADGVEARGAPAYVRRALDASLGRLQTDYVDLLYYHWPDGVTPIAETVGAMAELVREGKIRAIGISNVTVEQLGEAAATADIHAVQNEYSLLDRRAEQDVLPRCLELGVGFVPYYPLASGLLTGKYRFDEAAPAGTRWAGSRLARPRLGDPRRPDRANDVRQGRAPESLRAAARSHAARGRRRRACVAAGRRLGDRGRDVTGAGARERGGWGVALDRRRASGVVGGVTPARAPTGGR